VFSLSFEEIIGKIRNLDSYKETGKPPIWITEWGPSWYTQNSHNNGLINGNHIGASWIAAFFDSMIKMKVDNAGFLCLGDFFYADSNWSWPALFDCTDETKCENKDANGTAYCETKTPCTPKSAYYAFEMLSRLKGDFVKTVGGSLNVGSRAAKKDGKVSVLLWNHNYGWQGSYEDESKSENLRLNIQNLPQDIQSFQVAETLISEKYGNPFGKLVKKDKNISSEPLRQDLGKVEAIGGSASLELNLPPSGVALLEFSPVFAAPEPSPSPPPPPDEFSPPELIIKGKIQTLSSSEPVTTNSESIMFRGTLKNLPRGKVRIFQDGKRIKIKNLPKSGKWQTTVEIRKSRTFTFQFRYYDRDGREVYVSENFAVRKVR
jgi:hypothetical protein